jgi:hypothetical protein
LIQIKRLRGAIKVKRGQGKERDTLHKKIEMAKGTKENKKEIVCVWTVRVQIKG